jgi:Tat protein secretion system quality control protein TatD with DNase activity
MTQSNPVKVPRKRGRPKKNPCCSSTAKKSTNPPDWQVRSHVLSFGTFDSPKRCNFKGCNHMFKNSKSTARHFLRDHLGISLSKCRFCEKSYINPNARDMHMKLYHESELI